MQIPMTKNSTVELSVTSTQGHCEEEWDHFRPLITRLYFEEGLKLEDVRKELEKSFGFKASRKMYNSRIRRWGIKKSYTASEKQEIADKLAADKAMGTFQVPVINGRAVTRMDKIERYLRMQRMQAARNTVQTPDMTETTASSSDADEVDAEFPPSPSQAGLVKRQDQNFQDWLQSLLTSVPTNSSLGLSRHEKVLHFWAEGTRLWVVDSQAFRHLHTTTFIDEQSYQMTNKWYQEVIATLVHLRRSLELSANEEAIAALDKFCTDVGTILKTKYWPFINQLIAETVSRLWGDFDEWRTYLFSFLIRIASVVLGKEHNTTLLFRLLADDDSVDDLSVTMMHVGMDILHQNQTLYVDHVYELVKDGINVLMWNGKIESAKRHAIHHVDTSHAELGANHWVTHRALRILAFICKRNDELFEAREILLRILENQDPESVHHPELAAENSTDILIFLGDICGRLGYYEESEKYMTHFLQVAPFYAPNTVREEWRFRALCLLSELFLRQGKTDEFRDLEPLDESIAAKRAQAWAQVRLKYW